MRRLHRAVVSLWLRILDTYRVPAYLADVEIDMTIGAASSPVAAHHVVLVVDDEPASQRAIRRALAEEGQIITASSAAEGLAILARGAVALVVTDQRMPGMSGLAFLREAVERWPHVVRVVLTAYADCDTVMDAINSGRVYFFLTKPWQVEQLRLVVRRGLEHFVHEAERVRLQADLEHSYMRVQREAEQKSRLLAMTAHELGTPVHILMNALALMREDGLPLPARPWARMAAQAAEWLARGLAQLRGTVALREGNLRHRPLDVGRLVANVVTEIQRAACARVLAISATVPADPVVISGDRRWLRLAVWNLMTNAVRFTPDGGTVSAAVRTHDHGVVVTIRDSGIGVPAEHLDEIFEPFSNAGGDVSLHGSGLFGFGARGLGLGLAIVKGVVAVHGGEVAVRSTPAGTCVELRLPVAPRVSEADRHVSG